MADGQIDMETQNLIAEVEMLIPAIAPLFDLIQQAAPVIQARWSGVGRGDRGQAGLGVDDPEGGLERHGHLQGGVVPAHPGE